MAHLSPDSFNVPISEEHDDRMLQVSIILECLKSLNQHIDCLEQESVESFGQSTKGSSDVAKIQYVLWLSQASKNVQETRQNLKLKLNYYRILHDDSRNKPSSVTLLDQTVYEDVTSPIVPQPVWQPPTEAEDWTTPIKRVCKDEDSPVFQNYATSESKASQDLVVKLRKKLRKRQSEMSNRLRSQRERATIVQDNFRVLGRNVVKLKYTSRLLESNVIKSATRCARLAAESRDYAGQVQGLSQELAESEREKLSLRQRVSEIANASRNPRSSTPNVVARVKPHAKVLNPLKLNL